MPRCVVCGVGRPGVCDGVCVCVGVWQVSEQVFILSRFIASCSGSTEEARASDQ